MRASAVSRITEGTDWLQLHEEHVQNVQEFKQHHIHLPNDKGEEMPLTHCRRPDTPVHANLIFLERDG